MRHFILAAAIAAHSFGVRKPAMATALIALSGLAHAGLTGDLRAVAVAVDLAAVATTTDQRLSAAFRTHEQPGRRRGAVTGSADSPWTSAMIAGILTPHACPARCGARRRRSPRSLNARLIFPAASSRTRPEMQMPPGSANGSRRAAIITPSPSRSSPAVSFAASFAVSVSLALPFIVCSAWPEGGFPFHSKARAKRHGSGTSPGSFTGSPMPVGGKSFSPKCGQNDIAELPSSALSPRRSNTRGLSR